MSDSRLDERIIRVFEAYSRQDAAGAAAEFADDGTFHEVPRNLEFSKPEFRTFLEDTIFELYPDYTVEDYEAFTTHEWGTLIEWKFSGTHEGQVGDTEPTGAKISHPIVSVVTYGEDGISTWMDYFDPHALDDQLGRS